MTQQQTTTQPILPQETSVSVLTKMLGVIKVKLNRLKQILGFDTIKDEYSKYLHLKDDFYRNKAMLSVNDAIYNKVSGNAESLLGRLEELETLSEDEVKALKRYENVLTVFGKKINLSDYKSYTRIAMYVGAGYIVYKFVLRPFVFPAAKKILMTKVRTKRRPEPKQADYRMV